MISAQDKAQAIALTQEACKTGCRAHKACEILSTIERARILEIANSAEYCDQPPSQIVPKLADRSIYIASESSFYRILKQENQLTHRGASRPKPGGLVALKSNQVWSWDISYLPSPIRGQFFYLYFFLDIFSRKIVGFDVFEQESAEHAAEVVSKAYRAENLGPGECNPAFRQRKPHEGLYNAFNASEAWDHAFF